MGIVTFERAERLGSHVLIALYGESGSGKTYSAILLARGLAGPDGRVAFLDTETGRGRIYADLAGGFDYGELTPPYTPERYAEAIQAAEAAGYDVLVIDSASHEWEGIGGITESAEEGGGKGLQKWMKPKMRHKRFMQRLLSTRMHVILCLRAKEKMAQRKGQNGKEEIVSEGFVSVQDKRFIYEMTIQCFMPHQQNGKRGVPVIEKCPEELMPAFPLGDRISVESGARIAEWVRGGKPVDHAWDAFRLRAEEIAGQGKVALREWWGTLTGGDKTRARAIADNLASIANEADAEKARAAAEADDPPPIAFGATHPTTDAPQPDQSASPPADADSIMGDLPQDDLLAGEEFPGDLPSRDEVVAAWVKYRQEAGTLTAARGWNTYKINNAGVASAYANLGAEQSVEVEQFQGRIDCNLGVAK